MAPKSVKAVYGERWWEFKELVSFKRGVKEINSNWWLKATRDMVTELTKHKSDEA